MGSAVSAAEANRNFSTVLRQVRGGRSFVVTSHGRPVARIVPIEHGDRVAGSARTTLFERLRRSRITTTAAWSRDDLHAERR